MVDEGGDGQRKGQFQQARQHGAAEIQPEQPQPGPVIGKELTQHGMSFLRPFALSPSGGNDHWGATGPYPLASASTGSSREALRAGRKPKAMPIRVADSTAATMACVE